jgi:tryptophan 7-halogenase
MSFNPAERDEYNRLTKIQWEQIRDFLILHYKLNERTGSEFWTRCAAMDIPETLQRKMDLFAGRGRLFRYEDELFADASWTAVMIGQGLVPKGYDTLADALDDQQLTQMVGQMASIFERTANTMPHHADYVARTCQGSPL